MAFIFLFLEASFSTNEASAAGTSKETVAFKVIFNKQKHDVEFDLDKTIGDVKAGIEKIIGKSTFFC